MIAYFDVGEGDTFAFFILEGRILIRLDDLGLSVWTQMVSLVSSIDFTSPAMNLVPSPICCICSADGGPPAPGPPGPAHSRTDKARRQFAGITSGFRADHDVVALGEIRNLGFLAILAEAGIAGDRDRNRLAIVRLDHHGVRRNGINGSRDSREVGEAPAALSAAARTLGWLILSRRNQQVSRRETWRRQTLPAAAS